MDDRQPAGGSGILGRAPGYPGDGSIAIQPGALAAAGVYTANVILPPTAMWVHLPGIWAAWGTLSPFLPKSWRWVAFGAILLFLIAVLIHSACSWRNQSCKIVG